MMTLRVAERLGGPHSSRDSRSSWSIPNVSRLSHAVRPGRRHLGSWLGIGPAGAAARPRSRPRRPAGIDEAVRRDHPGTDVKFEMLPIPGGTFEMGSPPE